MLSAENKALLPTVTVMITARNRPDELQKTLRLLRKQTYPSVELLVFDDASSSPLEALVQQEWPNAIVVRNETSYGYIANRSRGFALAGGEFILSLDDDSCLTGPGDLMTAVEYIQSHPSVGVLAFRVHNGQEFVPPQDSGDVRFLHSFTGCAHVIRKEACWMLGGYRDFFEYYAEENEYALRVMDAGWRIVYMPSICVHHRVSSIGRNLARIWAYSLRNNIWTILLNIPARRLPVELAWKMFVGAVESVRLLQIGWFFWAIGSALKSAPRALRLRRPISAETLRVYDCLRFGLDPKDGKISISEVLRWWRQNWLKRRRANAFWNSGSHGIGGSSTATFSEIEVSSTVGRDQGR
ncbi:MAG: glycosyltransferase [Bryobacteraceae bacterium]